MFSIFINWLLSFSYFFDKVLIAFENLLEAVQKKFIDTQVSAAQLKWFGELLEKFVDESKEPENDMIKATKGISTILKSQYLIKTIMIKELGFEESKEIIVNGVVVGHYVPLRRYVEEYIQNNPHIIPEILREQEMTDEEFVPEDFVEDLDCEKNRRNQIKGE